MALVVHKYMHGTRSAKIHVWHMQCKKSCMTHVMPRHLQCTNTYMCTKTFANQVREYYTLNTNYMEYMKHTRTHSSHNLSICAGQEICILYTCNLTQASHIGTGKILSQPFYWRKDLTRYSRPHYLLSSHSVQIHQI